MVSGGGHSTYYYPIYLIITANGPRTTLHGRMIAPSPTAQLHPDSRAENVRSTFNFNLAMQLSLLPVR